MKILFGNYTLGDDEDGAEVSGLTSERVHSVEVTPIIGSNKPLVIPRGNATLRVSFTVSYIESDRAASLARQLFGYGNMLALGYQGRGIPLTFIEGGFTHGYDDVSLESMSSPVRRGIHTTITYTFLAPYPADHYSWPHNPPIEPSPLSPPYLVQGGRIPLQTSANQPSTITVVFETPYSIPPTVIASMETPSGQPPITVTLLEASTTTATLAISSVPTTSGYALHWIASPMPDPTQPSTMTLADTLSLTTAAETVVITFEDEQATPPDSVTAIYLKPAPGGDNILAVPVLSSLSTTGFTVELSAPAQAGSSLAWSATFDLTIP